MPQINLPRGGPLNAQRVSKRDQQLIVVLISEVFMYVCTNLLYSINIAYSTITAGQDKTIERLRIEAFVAYLSTPFLVLINNCFPFYLYCMVSSKFRNDVRQLFSCLGCTARIAPEQPRPPVATLNRISVVANASWETPCLWIALLQQEVDDESWSKGFLAIKVKWIFVSFSLHDDYRLSLFERI